MDRAREGLADALHDQSARLRLLAAAEGLLLTSGAHMLSTRAIGAVARTNISQIRYYFGGLEGLLDVLVGDELQAVTSAFDNADLSDESHTVESLMRILLSALCAAAPYTAGGFAALAIEEVHHHVSGEMRRRIAATLNEAHAPFRAAMAKRLPHLDDLTIRIRLAAIIAMAMSLLPRSTGWRLLASTEAHPVSQKQLYENGVAIAVNAWK